MKLTRPILPMQIRMSRALDRNRKLNSNVAGVGGAGGGGVADRAILIRAAGRRDPNSLEFSGTNANRIYLDGIFVISGEISLQN